MDGLDWAGIGPVLEKGEAKATENPGSGVKGWLQKKSWKTRVGGCSIPREWLRGWSRLHEGFSLATRPHCMTCHATSPVLTCSGEKAHFPTSSRFSAQGSTSNICICIP